MRDCWMINAQTLRTLWAGAAVVYVIAALVLLWFPALTLLLGAAFVVPLTVATFLYASRRGRIVIGAWSLLIVPFVGFGVAAMNSPKGASSWLPSEHVQVIGLMCVLFPVATALVARWALRESSARPAT